MPDVRQTHQPVVAEFLRLLLRPPKLRPTHQWYTDPTVAAVPADAPTAINAVVIIVAMRFSLYSYLYKPTLIVGKVAIVSGLTLMLTSSAHPNRPLTVMFDDLLGTGLSRGSIPILRIVTLFFIISQ